MMGKQTLETTVGDLIAALTEEAISFTWDEKEAYQLVAQMLADLLNNSGPISKADTRDSRALISGARR